MSTIAVNDYLITVYSQHAVNTEVTDFYYDPTAQDNIRHMTAYFDISDLTT